MRQLPDIAASPQRGDAFEFKGKVFEVVALDGDKVIYRIHPAVPRRARWMTRYGWKTLAETTGAEASDYTSGG